MTKARLFAFLEMATSKGCGLTLDVQNQIRKGAGEAVVRIKGHVLGVTQRKLVIKPNLHLANVEIRKMHHVMTAWGDVLTE